MSESHYRVPRLHRTKSETLFETFLEGHGLQFERIQVAETPRPDYFVTFGESRLLFEIKEMYKNESFRGGPGEIHSGIVGDHIRTKIKDASKQIRFGIQQGIPSVLVLYNAFDPLQLWGIEDDDFRAAMYGEHTVRLEPTSGKIVDSFEGRNESFTNTSRTHFSALARLSDRGGRITLTIFENIFAAVAVKYDALPPCFDVVRIELVTPPGA